MYEVLLSTGAERDLKRLPAAIFHRVIAEIKALSATPRPSGTTKLAGSDRHQRIYNLEFRISNFEF